MIKAVSVIEKGIDRSSPLWGQIQESMREIYGPDATHDKMFPLRPFRIFFTVDKLSIAYANAIRRCALDETEQLCLVTDKIHSTDPYATVEYVRIRLNTVHLRQNLHNDGNNLVFELHKHNTGTDHMPIYMRDLTIKQGSLTEPIFNPGMQICTLLRGKRLDIDEIRVECDIGRNNAVHTLFHQCGLKALDLTVRERPNPSMAVFQYDIQKAAAMSRYLESSSNCRPMSHELALGITAPNALMVKESVQGVIDNIKRRVIRLNDVVDGNTNDSFSYVEDKKTGVTHVRLTVYYETATLGALFSDEIYHYFSKDIKNVKMEAIPHNKYLDVKVGYLNGDKVPPAVWFKKVIKQIYDKLDKLVV